MNLDRAKELLVAKGIPFYIEEYVNEAEFWQHIFLFPYTMNAADCSTAVLVIGSNNGHKNLELQFTKAEEYVLKELWFGDCSFDIFEYEPDTMENVVLSDIESVMSGNLMAFSINDLNKKRWLGEGITKKDSDYAEKIRREALKPKSWKQRLRRVKLQYEFYDWNNYQKIIK